ncbi:hypothetical protein Plhal304r1_c001g0000141 [Plasmopara halstedii]
MISRIVLCHRGVSSRALSTSALETYSFVHARTEYRKEVAMLRKVFIKEEKHRKLRLKRDAEAECQKLTMAKAARLEIKRQQRELRAKDVAYEKTAQAEKARKRFEEKNSIRQERAAEVERRREALLVSLRQQVNKWTTAENYSEKLKEDVFIYSPHQISARGLFDISNTSGSAISWLEKLQRMKPAGMLDSSDEAAASTVASTADDEDSSSHVLSTDASNIMEASKVKKTD